MSYARFGWDDSDVYVYQSRSGIECCGCWLSDDEDNHWFIATTAREMITHLEEHRAKGDHVPDDCLTEIRHDFPDLDAVIANG